ncbi:MAG: hypothetical protein V9E82_10870 [Candidatus Nanopelagicales bacterium]
MRGRCRPDARQHLEKDAQAVLERAAVLVVAVVAAAVEELPDQVAMGAVHFDAVESGVLGAHCGGDEIPDDLGDLGGGHGHRIVARVVPGALDLAAGDLAFGPPSTVVQLHGRGGAVRSDGVGQPLQARIMLW